MSTVRYMARLYARRNNGLDPTTHALAARSGVPSHETPASRPADLRAAARPRPPEKERVERQGANHTENKKKKLPEEQDQGSQ